MLFNVPTGSATYVQHVINTNTGAWCRWTDIDANCWGMFNDQLYFGGNGAIYMFGEEDDDYGAGIAADAMTAFQYLGQQARIKQVTAVQIEIAAQADTSLGVSVLMDFQTTPRPSVNLTQASSGTPWGSPWGSSWSASLINYRPWKSVSAYGRAAALRMTVESKNQIINWYASTFIFKEGGAI
jgi:hypothetical protein